LWHRVRNFQRAGAYTSVVHLSVNFGQEMADSVRHKVVAM
jgi:hypothetical protein